MNMCTQTTLLHLRTLAGPVTAYSVLGQKMFNQCIFQHFFESTFAQLFKLSVLSRVQTKTVRHNCGVVWCIGGRESDIVSQGGCSEGGVRVRVQRRVCVSGSFRNDNVFKMALHPLCGPSKRLPCIVARCFKEREATTLFNSRVFPMLNVWRFQYVSLLLRQSTLRKKATKPPTASARQKSVPAASSVFFSR